MAATLFYRTGSNIIQQYLCRHEITNNDWLPFVFIKSNSPNHHDMDQFAHRAINPVKLKQMSVGTLVLIPNNSHMNSSHPRIIA